MKHVPDRKKLNRIYRAGHREEPGLSDAVFRWFVTLFVCVIVWAVVSPIFYENVVMGNGACVLGIGVCIIVPLLLVSVRSTSNVIQQVKEEHFPSATPNTLPADEILVRGSEEPPIVQSNVLLRAVKGAETPKEELLRVAEE